MGGEAGWPGVGLLGRPSPAGLWSRPRSAAAGPASQAEGVGERRIGAGRLGGMGLGFILRSQKMPRGREEQSGPQGAAEWRAWEGADAGGGGMRGGPGLGCGGVEN